MLSQKKTKKAGISGAQNRTKDSVEKRIKRENRLLVEDGIETCSPKVKDLGRDMSSSWKTTT